MRPPTPHVPLRFRLSGFLGAAGVVSVAASVIMWLGGVWSLARAVGAIGGVVSAAAAANYLSQLAFPAWWLAPLSEPAAAPWMPEFTRTFRTHAIKSVAVSLLAVLVCSGVVLVARDP